VDGLSPEVPSGIIFGLLGPNGAGRTTTMHLVPGIWTPSGRAEAVTGEMENQRGKASVEEVFLSLMEEDR
jgi:ABC-type multidrug transport system ATPase subunit